MTDSLNTLISSIVKKFFGDVAELIIVNLSKRDFLTLSDIISSCRSSEKKLKTDLIKKCVAVLLHHNLVRAVEREKKPIAYSIQWKTCYSCIRWSRFTCLVNQSFGEIAEMMVEELFLLGRASADDLILKTAERMQESLETDEGGDSSSQSVDITRIGQTMARLVTAHNILERAPPSLLEPDDASEEAKNLAKLRFILPSNHDAKVSTLRRQWARRDREEAEEAEEPAAKRCRVDEVPETDAQPVQFRVNLARLEALWRDEIIACRAEARTEAACASFLRHLLARCRVGRPDYRNEWDLTSSQTSEMELRRSLPPDLEALPASHVDQCIRLLCEDTGCFLMKVEHSGGGAILVCPFERVWAGITRELVESVVQERLGAHATRAFRLVCAENYVTLQHIEEKTMLNSILCRQYVYRLQDQNFIKKVELSKTNDFSTTSAVYLYHVELPAVVRMVLQWSYQGLYRLMVCRENQLVNNKRLFDKQLRVDALVASMDEQISSLEDADEAEEETEDLLTQLREQREEIPKAITPSEQQQLQRAHNSVQKLSQAEVEVDEQIFIMERFLHFQLPAALVKEK